MKSASRKYYKDIKVLIPIRRKYERRLLEQIKQRVMELESSCDNITYDCLVEAIGAPADIINNYYANVDLTHLIRRMRIARTVRICAYILLFLVTLALAVNICTNVWLYIQTNNGIITDATKLFY